MFRALTRRLQAPGALFVLGTVVAITVGLPLLHVLFGITAASLSVLAHAPVWISFAHTLALAGAVTAVTIVIGVPLGAVFARARIAACGLLLALHVVPLFLPPLVTALGWFHLFGERGLLGSARTSELLFGPAGVVLVLAMAFMPIVSTLTMLGLGGLDASLEEAALLVASPWRVLTHLLIPAVRSRIAVAAIIVFSLTLAEIGVPMFLRVTVYGAVVFARLGGVDFAPGDAAALGLPMLAVGLALVELERRLSRSGGALRLRGRARARFALGAGPTVLAVLASLVACAPVFALASRAGSGLERGWGWAGPSLVNSVVASSSAAVVSTCLALIAGHALARRSVVAVGVDRVAVMGFFVPSAVLGTGIIATWNRPATQMVYGSLAIVSVAFVARYFVLPLRIAHASMANVSRAYEDAATVAGASYFRRLGRIVLPMHARDLVLALGMALVFGMRDLETAVLFYPPGGETLPVRIFTLEANSAPPVVAALAMVQIVVMLVIVAVGALVLRRLG